MAIVRCEDGPFAEHLAFVREGTTRVELYDVHFNGSPEPYLLEADASGEPVLRWARAKATERALFGSPRPRHDGDSQALST